MIKSQTFPDSPAFTFEIISVPVLSVVFPSESDPTTVIERLHTSSTKFTLDKSIVSFLYPFPIDSPNSIPATDSFNAISRSVSPYIIATPVETLETETSPFSSHGTIMLSLLKSRIVVASATFSFTRL